MHIIVVIDSIVGYAKMDTKLDNVKSTITVSLGTKNRLRKIKGDQSYEDYINYLIRRRNQISHDDANRIEFQKFERKKATFRLRMSELISNDPDFYILTFSYNQYNQSSYFWFDLKIETIRGSTGRIIALEDFKKELHLPIFSNKNKLSFDYRIYFLLLEEAIRKEIEPQFRHKGRFEDYYLWEKEFRILNLPKKSFDEDILDKLNDLNSEIGVF